MPRALRDSPGLCFASLADSLHRSYTTDINQTPTSASRKLKRLFFPLQPSKYHIYILDFLHARHVSMVSMEGVIHGPLHLTLDTPRSLTHKRGIKRAAPDSDEPQRPDPPRSQQPRVVTGMLAFIPENLWEYGSVFINGLVQLFASKHAPPQEQPTQITGIATDLSDKKRRAVDTSPINVSHPRNSPTDTPTARRVVHPMGMGGLNIRRRVLGTSAAAPVAASAASEKNSLKEMTRRVDHAAYYDTALPDLLKKIAQTKAQKSHTTTHPSTVGQKVPIKDRQISGLIHKAHKAQKTTTAQTALQQKKAAEEQAAVEKEAADIAAAAEEAARLELEKEKALLAAEQEKQRIAAEEQQRIEAEKEQQRVAAEEQEQLVAAEEEQLRLQAYGAFDAAGALQQQKLTEEKWREEYAAERRDETVSNLIGHHWDDLEEKIELSELRDRDTVVETAGIPLQLLTFKRILSNDGADSWLDDDAVNAWFNSIVGKKKSDVGYVKSDTNPPTFANLQTAWYAKFSKEKAKGLKRWMKRAGVGGDSILKCERIFLPINTGSHWTLLIINGVDRSIEYLDSLGGNGGKFFQIARDILKSELNDKYHEKEWTELKRNRSSPQDNMNDCGVFVCMNGLAAAKGRPYRDVTAQLMPKARLMMAGVLLCYNGFAEVVFW